MRFLLASVLFLLVAGCGSVPADDSSEADGQTGLGCSVGEQRAVDLDVPGPGMPTPEEAVNAVSDGLATVVSKAAGAATVNTLGPDGTVMRVFELTQREDGWWPDSYTECSD